MPKYAIVVCLLINRIITNSPRRSRSAYNTQAFEVHRQLQPFDNLSVHYYQLLQGRFNRLFDDYDALLTRISPTEGPAPEFTHIIGMLERYYADAREDLLQRQRRAKAQREPIFPTDQRFASLFVTQIRRLCDRSSVRLEKRLKRGPGLRQQPTDQTSYLFQEILGNASDRTGYFGLDVLQACSSESLEKFQPDQDNQPGLRTLREILRTEGASLAYQTRFAALVTEEAEE
jgi:hypothetical protein